MWSSNILAIISLSLSTHVLLLVLLAFIIWNICSKYLNSNSQPKSPPGPWKLPIIGNMHQLAAAHPLPHHALRDLAKMHGPVMSLKLGQMEAVVISSTKAAIEVLKTHDINFAQRPPTFYAECLTFGQGSFAFAPYGDWWREVRKIFVTQLFSSKHVQGFGFIREREIRNFVTSISSTSKSSSINFSKESALLANNIVSSAAFGSKCRHQAEFLAALEEAMRLFGLYNIPDLFPSLRFLCYLTGTTPAMRKAQNKIGDVIDSIVEDHKRKRAIEDHNDDDHEEDIVDVFLKHHESNSKLDFKLTTGQIKDIVLEIFTAGSDTAATILTWIMSELLKNPRAMRKVQAEVRRSSLLACEGNNAAHNKMDYLKSVVKETLRLHPPLPISTRQSSERCEILGYELPAKTRTIINLWALARDPKQWGDDVDSFKPERFLNGDSKNVGVDFRGNDFEMLPFGSGRRVCPGMTFATAVIEQTLFELLYRFDWELADGMKPDDLAMNERMGAACKKRDDLYVIATPYFA